MHVDFTPKILTNFENHAPGSMQMQLNIAIVHHRLICLHNFRLLGLRLRKVLPLLLLLLFTFCCCYYIKILAIRNEAATKTNCSLHPTPPLVVATKKGFLFMFSVSFCGNFLFYIFVYFFPFLNGEAV